MENLNKLLQKCKHPNARKTLTLAKKVKKLNKKQHLKIGNAFKTLVNGEKLAWFSEQINDKNEPLTPQEFQNLIEKYLNRFDDELEQIKLKQSISKNRKNQHAARERIIKITLEREKNEYNGGGIELINLCDPLKMNSLKNWDGTDINIQHLKLDLISKRFIDKQIMEVMEKPTIIITPPDEECKTMEE